MLFALQDQGFMPHGMCYLWQPGLLWTHVIADGLVAASYFAIPPGLIYIVVRTRREMAKRGIDPSRFRYQGIFWLFAGFIVACGITHAMGIWTVWEPVYYLSGTAKVVTAGISVTTAIVLPMLAPKVTDIFMGHFEVEEKNESLTRLAKELEFAGEERERVVKTMAGWLAHDLNNRLQGIQGSAELLAMDGGAGALRALQDEVERASGTIRRLQTIAFSRGQLPLEPVDLVPIVTHVVQEFDDVRVVLESSGPAVATADPSRVVQIVHELLDNAGEAAGADGEVRVRIEPPGAGDTGSGACVSVENPIGSLSDDVGAHMFDAFVSGRTGRAGLGLTIARRNAVEMGASLTAVRVTEDEIRVELRFPNTALPDEGPAQDAP